MPNRLSMVVFSGTVDRLYPAAIMASGAVAMGMDVDIFLTFYGLDAFRKGQPSTNTKMDVNYAELAPMLAQLMREKNVPSWYEMLRIAKEMGKVRVHACAMTLDLMGLKKDDLDPIIDDVVGVGEFVSQAKEGEITLFL
ncbi:MAG TPA: DsrE/DsrF/DrsH-like family protein [Thermoplasmata archaeon]|nr:DsrE/DsrF/DrsH-like family protein [Thermoplasmata archaeon]